jgi:hypothetical protein
MEPTIRTEQQEEISLAEQMKLDELAEDAGLIQFLAEMEKLGHENPPDLDMLKKWKSLHGNIYMSHVNDIEEIFIWRVLYRPEWREMLNKIDINNPMQREDYVVKKCLLYPDMDTIFYRRGAGFTKSLYTSIMFQSGFVEDSQVINTICIIE